MTARTALTDVHAALEAAGFHVALHDQDLTPPVFLLRLGTLSDAGPPLDQSGKAMATVYAYFIPVRGNTDSLGDADTIDIAYAVLTPLTWDTLVATASSVTAAGEQWPCYRLDVTLIGDNPYINPQED